MKYLLVLGFFCEVYRREPRARVFLNDTLIDEFYIAHHKDTLTNKLENFIQSKNILQPISRIDTFNIVKNLFPPLKFYELSMYERQNIDKIKFRIDIENNDNNYANGFMTASTLLKLNLFYFFPLHKKLISRLDKIAEKNKNSKNYAWIRNEKNFFFDLLPHTQWYSKNTQTSCDNTGYGLKEQSLGSNGYFTCELQKKYNIFITKLKKTHKYTINKRNIDHFYNKYQQNENT